MNLRPLILLSIAALMMPVAASASWTAPARPTSTALPVISATATDPIGDTFNPGPDITVFSASSDGTQLKLVLGFAGVVQGLPGTGIGNEVAGAIEIDVNPELDVGDTTQSGVLLFCGIGANLFRPDFGIQLFDYNPGTLTAPLLDYNTLLSAGDVPVSFSGNTMTAMVPLSLLSGDDQVNVAAIVGNTLAPTDCAPNNTVLSSSAGVATAIPAASMSGWTLLGLSLCAVGLVMSRRVMR